MAAVPFLGKMAGAVGNYNAHMSAYLEVYWQAVAQEFVPSLGEAGAGWRGWGPEGGIRWPRRKEWRGLQWERAPKARSGHAWVPWLAEERVAQCVSGGSYATNLHCRGVMAGGRQATRYRYAAPLLSCQPPACRMRACTARLA